MQVRAARSWRYGFLTPVGDQLIGAAHRQGRPLRGIEGAHDELPLHLLDRYLDIRGDAKRNDGAGWSLTDLHGGGDRFEFVENLADHPTLSSGKALRGRQNAIIRQGELLRDEFHPSACRSLMSWVCRAWSASTASWALLRAASAAANSDSQVAKALSRASCFSVRMRRASAARKAAMVASPAKVVT